MMKRGIVLLLLLAALLPLIAARIAVEASSARSLRMTMTNHAADHAQAVAVLVGQELASDMRAAEALGQSPIFDGPIDADRLAIVAKRLLGANRRWRAIGVSDPAGRRLFAEPGILGGETDGPAADPDRRRTVVQSMRSVVVGVVGDPRGGAGVAIGAPVVRDGRVVYLLSLVIGRKSFSPLLLADGLPKDWPVRLLDGRGMLVAGSDGSGADSTEPFVAWRNVAGTDWRVGVAISDQAYAAPLRRAIVRAGTTMVLGIGLLAWFFFLLRRAVRQERRRVAAALEGQRLEVLGRMTSGIAHDFNNLLTPIVGVFDLLIRRLGGDPRTDMLIDAGLLSVERAKVLVAHLLAYSRPETLRPRHVDVRKLVADLRDLLSRTIGPSIDLELELPAEASWARVDPVQLELALINLAINARDAMPGGGTLTVEVAERTSAYSPDLEPGRYVCIGVCDTGQGMSAGTLKIATEPFFTTKSIGAGTGLGLAMVNKLAIESGGTIVLTSEAGEGTVVELWLPAADGPGERRIEGDWVARRGTGRLLLVDDEPQVRIAHAEMLRDAGYTVTAVASSAEALDVLRMEGNFELLIADHAMPRMSGAELALEVRAFHPTLPILILTGFAGGVGELPDGIGLLMKPVRQAALLAQVAAMLGTARGRE